MTETERRAVKQFLSRILDALDSPRPSRYLAMGRHEEVVKTEAEKKDPRAADHAGRWQSVREVSVDSPPCRSRGPSRCAVRSAGDRHTSKPDRPRLRRHLLGQGQQPTTRRGENQRSGLRHRKRRLQRPKPRAAATSLQARRENEAENTKRERSARNHRTE